MYFLNLFGCKAVVNGKLHNVASDLHLVSTQYYTCLRIFFVGDLFGQVPSNMLFTRMESSHYMAGWMIGSVDGV
jgi:hypothetical protein